MFCSMLFLTRHVWKPLTQRQLAYRNALSPLSRKPTLFQKVLKKPKKRWGRLVFLPSPEKYLFIFSGSVPSFSLYLLYQWELIAYPSISAYFAGTLQSQSPVPSPCTSIPTHRVLKFWKTLGVLKTWCRTFAVIWTQCVMLWTKWTSIWGFDAWDQCHYQHDLFGALQQFSQCHITPITVCVMAWLVSMQFCVSLSTCNLLC